MKRLIIFWRQYKLFGLSLFAVVIGLILQLSNHKTAADWVLGTVAILSTLPLLWDMIEDVRAGAYGIDILAITAIVTAVLLGEFWAAIVVVIMLTGGEALEDFAERRARRELDSLLRHVPREATVIKKGKRIEVKASEVKPGDKIVIKAGEAVPADAEILEGRANFDESSLTGESIPVLRQNDDRILSGTINQDGEVIARATASAADSQYQQIVRLVRAAAASRSPYVRLAERYSLPFTFTAFAIASAVWIVSGQAVRFLEVIIVATPCPLLLAAPIALVSGMARASRYGIIVKTGSALERLAEARTIAFDKTGTITKGQLVVSEVTALKPFKIDDVLCLAASLEQSSNHVVARAIVDAAVAKKLKLIKAKHVRETAGLGLQATLQSKEIVVGRLQLLHEAGVEVPAKVASAKQNGTTVYVAVKGEVAGYICLTDEIRPEAPNTLKTLHANGIKHLLMVTGDQRSAAEAIARTLNISDVHAEALPGDKLRILEKVPASERPLVFVGDGVNDAPVLASATVGIALGARGSAAASESADMVVMHDDIGRVATAYSIARRTFAIARQSIFIGIGLSLALMLIFATGKFPPLAGAIAQEVVDVFVIFNALRAHFGPVR